MPTELKLPDPPGEVEKRLHELTHLPYAAWCESCVRGRGRSDPHHQLTEVVREKPCPQVCLDWFDVAGSNQDGERDEGVMQALLVIDAETGYTAAIPAPSKGAAHYTHLAKTIVTFLKLMR